MISVDLWADLVQFQIYSFVPLMVALVLEQIYGPKLRRQRPGMEACK